MNRKFKAVSLGAFALASMLSLSMMSNSTKSLKVNALSEQDYIDFEITGLDRTTDFISGTNWRFEFKTNISFNNADGSVYTNLCADKTNTTLKIDGVTNTLLDSSGVTCKELSTTDEDFTILLAQEGTSDPSVYSSQYPGLAKYDENNPNGYGGQKHIIEMASGTTFGKYRLINDVTITISRFNQAWLNVELADYKEVQNSDLIDRGTQVPESITPTDWIQPEFTTNLDTNSFVYKCKYTHASVTRFIDLRDNSWDGLRLIITPEGNIEYWPNGSNVNNNGRVWELSQFTAGQNYQLKIGCIDIKNTNLVWIFVNINGVDKVSFLEEKKATSIFSGFLSWASGAGGTFEQVDYKVTIDGVTQTVLPGTKITKPEKENYSDAENHYEWQWENNGVQWNFNDEVHSDLNLVSKQVGTAHTLKKGDKYVAPTWETAGSQNYVCSECDFEKFESIPALKEDFINSKTMASLSFDYVKHSNGTYDTFANIQMQFFIDFDCTSYTDIKECGIIVTKDRSILEIPENVSGEYTATKDKVLAETQFANIQNDNSNYRIFNNTNKKSNYVVGINLPDERLADIKNTQLIAVCYARTETGYYLNVAKVYSLLDMLTIYGNDNSIVNDDKVSDLANSLSKQILGEE